MTTGEHKHPLIERTNHSRYYYDAAFGPALENGAVRTIVDVGAGDSDFAEWQKCEGRMVVRVDKDYDTTAPAGADWLADDATAMSLDDNMSDLTVSTFLMQHLSPEAQAKAIQEMLRVTSIYDNATKTGIVALYPAYKVETVRERLIEEGLSGFVIDRCDYKKFDMFPKKVRHEHPTLWIVNAAELSERVELLSKVIAESGALNRRRTVRDIARRAYMSVTGQSQIDCSGQ